jgi:serine phosphatase RsbU (regulator of sigma subunit)/anti-sigma regulatory factor (Ser/Thr protein kinase)
MGIDQTGRGNGFDQRDGSQPSDSQLRYLLLVSDVLGGSLDLQETVMALADIAVPELADSSAVHLVRGREVLLVAAAHVDRGRERVLAGLAARQEPTDDEVARDVASAEEPYLDERANRLWVPLRRNGRPLGALSLAMDWSDRSLGQVQLPLVREVARRAGVAIDHALRYRELTLEARHLQRSLLPSSMPLIPGLQFAARYRPAGDGHEVSGDFLDVFPVGASSWALAIGDVSGKGVGSATLTALVRHTTRRAAEGSEEPSEVLTAVNRAVLAAEPGERFCTMALANIEPAGAQTRVTLALGGHPRPLVLTADGTVEHVGVPGEPIGIDEDLDVDDVSVWLDRGDSLVLFTDGLSEARAPGADWGPEIRRALRGSADEDAAGLAATLEATVLRTRDGGPDDDIGVVVLRVPTASEAVAGPTLHERLPAEPIAAYAARAMARPWLDRQDLPIETRDDIVLVVSELVTNAARSATERVELRLWRTRENVLVEVSDDGEGFVPPPDSRRRPAPQAEAGRGLWLVQILSDDCRYNPGPWGTVVRCRFGVG